MAHDHAHKHDHDKKDQDHSHDHGHGHGHDDHGHDHGHEHSHEHGEDCKHCGPKVTTEDDVKDVAVPEWKKRALEKELDPSAAPFGMSWDVEASTSATAGGPKKEDAKPAAAAARDTGHSHEHEHAHGHGNNHKDHMEDDHGSDHSHEHSHGHDHGHSHEHGEDCEHCGKRVTTEDDVKDVEVPEWKKRALEKNLDPKAAPFGMSWDVEASTSATGK